MKESIKPERLKCGDTVGIISPSSGIFKRSELWRGIETLERMGFKVKVGKNAYKNNYYLAGTDQERANDLNDMFLDDSVDAIFCSQGGYGAGRILNLIDYEAIKENPKIMLGFSDITALHLAIRKKTNLVTFHGPSTAGFYGEFFTPFKEEMLKKALMQQEPIGNIPVSGEKDSYIVKIAKGKATGETVGGNLTLICSSLGTPYEIETKNKILFIEDVDVEPWIFDHMLTHLLNASKLKEVKGIVVGECSNCEPLEYKAGFECQCSLEDVLFDRLGNLGVPVLAGIPIGHIKDNCTIPLGVKATLDATIGKFSIDESGTI